jgi:hypothetical protein
MPPRNLPRISSVPCLITSQPLTLITLYGHHPLHLEIGTHSPVTAAGVIISTAHTLVEGIKAVHLEDIPMAREEDGISRKWATDPHTLSSAV